MLSYRNNLRESKTISRGRECIEHEIDYSRVLARMRSVCGTIVVKGLESQAYCTNYRMH
jgi:hypothetical protein